MTSTDRAAPSALLAAALLGAALTATAAPAPPSAKAPVPLPPNETIIDAAVANDPLPNVGRVLTAIYPVTLEARFLIDRAGRASGVQLGATNAPTELTTALRDALARWRFWPALGACRYVEQAASVTVVFEAASTRVEALTLQPVTARRALPEADFSWLDPADAGDRRMRPRLVPQGFVDPVALKQVMPRYPANASRKAEPGIAFVLFEVLADGKVGKLVSIDAWSSDPKLAPLFGKESAAAVKQWRFLPATLGGKPQRRLACQRFLFNMKLGG